MNLNRTEELEIKKDIKGIRKSIEKLADYFGPQAPPEDKVSDHSGDPFFGKIHMSQEHMDACERDFNSDYVMLVGLMEECAELQQAASKYYRTYRDTGGHNHCVAERAAMIEEMAHVLIDIRMICNALDISPDAIQQEIYKKYPDGYDVTVYMADNEPYYMERTKGSE